MTVCLVLRFGTRTLDTRNWAGDVALCSDVYIERLRRHQLRTMVTANLRQPSGL